MLEMILYAVAILALLIGSISDLKMREVPDWISYCLILFALAIRLIYTISTRDAEPFLQGLAGFGVLFLLALIMFYSGQWGGGDSKLLMGMGAVFGVPFNLNQIPIIIIFIINLLFLGAVYGFFWSFILILQKFKEFKKEFIILFKKRISKLWLKYSFIFMFCLLILVFFTDDRFLQVMLFSLSALTIITFFVSISIKAVENACMYKSLSPEKLTEGDWIAKDIVIKGKKICGPKDLGISKEQIQELIKFKKQKKISTVLIKEGIPFVPSFLFAFIATIWLGNWLTLLVR